VCWLLQPRAATAAGWTRSVVITPGRRADTTAIAGRSPGASSARRPRPLRLWGETPRRATAAVSRPFDSHRHHADRKRLPARPPATLRRAYGSTRTPASTTVPERAGTERRRKGRMTQAEAQKRGHRPGHGKLCW